MVELTTMMRLGWYIEFFLSVHFATNRASVPGISQRKVTIFWDRGDIFYGAHDILAPQPEAKNWPSEE